MSDPGIYWHATPGSEGGTSSSLLRKEKDNKAAKDIKRASLTSEATQFQIGLDKARNETRKAEKSKNMSPKKEMESETISREDQSSTEADPGKRQLANAHVRSEENEEGSCGSHLVKIDTDDVKATPADDDSATRSQFEQEMGIDFEKEEGEVFIQVRKRSISGERTCSANAPTS